MEQIQYPIGRFQPQPDYTTEEINILIRMLEEAPVSFTQPPRSLSEADLAKTYRPGSWTVRQLVHHVADFHLVNFLRLKKALTEENYEATLILMDDWATTPDAAEAPLDGSLEMLAGINQRFVYLVKSLEEETFTRTFYHPIRKINLSLKQLLFMAVWHVNHHQAHIALALGLPVQPFRFK